MKNIRHLSGRRLRFWCAVVCQIILTGLMLTPASDLPKIELPMWDKWAHLAVYALMFVLWARAFTLAYRPDRRVLALILVLTVYGIAIEVLQDQVIINRTGDSADVVANIFGILAVLLFYSWWERPRISKS